jgi:hypothetical protein
MANEGLMVLSFKKRTRLFSKKEAKTFIRLTIYHSEIRGGCPIPHQYSAGLGGERASL